jgi:hypothetical protein
VPADSVVGFHRGLAERFCAPPGPRWRPPTVGEVELLGADGRSRYELGSSRRIAVATA